MQSYVSMTNDSALLDERGADGTATHREVVHRLATHWRSLPRLPHSRYLVDYGSDAQAFLATGGVP